jgi:phosphoribosyl 1,2-cyclic phosphodiesterase
MFEVSVLASGSSGNCFYIGTEKANILIDAGISARQISERLKSIGRRIEDIHGIFMTHEHADHIKGIETISRKYNIPVFVNKGTLANSFLDMGDINFIKTDEDFDFNGLKILPFSKSHDAADPVSYLIKNGSKKLSVITDAGYCCHNIIDSIRESDLVILESNHDPYMLKNGNYPELLKKRIASDLGHLSNYQASLAVLEHGSRKLQHVLLAHLSLNNNTPTIALKTFNAIMCERHDLSHMKTWLTFRNKPTELIRIE